MSTGDQFGRLALSVVFTPSEVVIGVRGELDVLTAPDLATVLAAVADRGHPQVALDLSGLAFMGVAGIHLIATTSVRLRATGGVLVLRSTSRMARRMLDLTGVGDLVRFERPRPLAVALGPEQQLGDHSTDVTSAPVEVLLDITRFAAVPANKEVINAALRLVVALASATVGGADGVSVSLSRHGRIETVASSDDTIAKMDTHQYATGEGPCLAAAAEGHWFHVESLAEEKRWPQFTSRAIQDGIASILSTPLLVSGQPVGALNIYSSADYAFGPAEQELAALFATQASGILADAGITISAKEAESRVQDVLRSREVIAQAQGVMMERGGVSSEAAYGAIRRSARDAGTPVRQAATDVVASTIRESSNG